MLVPHQLWAGCALSIGVNVASFVVTLLVRIYLMAERGCEDDTPQDAKDYDGGGFFKLNPVLSAILSAVGAVASGVLWYTVSKYFVIPLALCTILPAVATWHTLEGWWLTRKAYVPHTRDEWMRDE